MIAHPFVRPFALNVAKHSVASLPREDAACGLTPNPNSCDSKGIGSACGGLSTSVAASAAAVAYSRRRRRSRKIGRPYSREAFAPRPEKPGLLEEAPPGGVHFTPSALIKLMFETHQPEALMEFLLDLGACSASASAAEGTSSTEVMLESPGDKVPLWRKSVVSGMFGEEVDAQRIAQAVQAAFDLAEPPIIETLPVEDKDWVTHVQKNWEPLPLGSSFQVLLPWHDGPVGGARTSAGRTVIRLEGGAAFGLGDHPTTQGAAAFVERVVPESAQAASNCRFLDYGCGSGVLALSAALLGASTALGVDVDSRSVCSAQRSASITLPGAYAGRALFRGSPSDFSEATGFAAALAQEFGHFDIVVANILRRPLVALAPALSAAARPGAMLALTGLRRDLDDYAAVCSAYAEWFEDFREVELNGGWILVEARRRQEEKAA